MPQKVPARHKAKLEASRSGWQRRETSLAELSLTGVHREEMQDRTHVPKDTGKGLKALGPGWVSGNAHPDTQPLCVPSQAHCPARLALNVTGLVPLGACHWDIAQPSSPGNL